MPAPKRTAYEDTKVDVHKTRGEIDRLLYKAGATGTAWMEGEHPQYPGRRVIALRFVRPEGKAPDQVQLAVRVMIPVPVDKDPKRQEQIRRQYHRHLYYYLKSQLEAVEFGLVQFTEAFLPHLEMGNGLTVYQQIGPQYLQAIRTGEIQMLALLPGGKSR